MDEECFKPNRLLFAGTAHRTQASASASSAFISQSGESRKNSWGIFFFVRRQIVNYENAMIGLGVHLTVMRRYGTTGSVQQEFADDE